jgi:hypothetical protein
MSEKSESAALENPQLDIPGQVPRPFRVKVRGSILALLRLPNRRMVRGKVHQISTTGGLLNVEKPLDEKLQLELIFHLGETTIRERVEMILDANLRALLHPDEEKSSAESSLQEDQATA